MEGLQIEAVYEKGTLKLPRELPLAEGQKVVITINSPGDAIKRRRELIQWKGSLEDLEYLIESDDNSIWAVEEQESSNEPGN